MGCSGGYVRGPGSRRPDGCLRLAGPARAGAAGPARASCPHGTGPGRSARGSRSRDLPGWGARADDLEPPRPPSRVPAPGDAVPRRSPQRTTGALARGPIGPSAQDRVRAGPPAPPRRVAAHRPIGPNRPTVRQSAPMDSRRGGRPPQVRPRPDSFGRPFRPKVRPVAPSPQRLARHRRIDRRRGLPLPFGAALAAGRRSARPRDPVDRQRRRRARRRPAWSAASAGS